MKIPTRNYFFREIIRILTRCQINLIDGSKETDGSTTTGESEITVFAHSENNTTLTLIHEALHQYFGDMWVNNEDTVENLSRELFTTFNDSQLDAIRLYLPKRR